jgi:hypothetical protein
MGSRRGVSEDKIHKKNLIAQLAARRKEGAASAADAPSAAAGAPPQRRQAILGLSSDSESGDDGDPDSPTSSFGSGRYEEPENSSFNASSDPSQPPAARKLNRLVKGGEARKGSGSSAATSKKGVTHPGEPKSEFAASAGDCDLADVLGRLRLRAPSAGSENSKHHEITSADDARPAVHPPQRSHAPPPQLPVPSESFPLPPPPLPSSNADPSRPDGDGGLVLGDSGDFRLSSKVSSMLYDHQITGIRWLHGLWRIGTGGILADDMGLGKTMQASAFLSGLLGSGLAHRAIVVAPKTLLAHWEKELTICGAGAHVRRFFGTAGERREALRAAMDSGGVLLTTYGMILHNGDALSCWDGHDSDDGPLWDIIFLDEGHKLKNPKMQFRAALDKVPCRSRVVVTGTPIQNNVGEMWALLDFACQVRSRFCHR